MDDAARLSTRTVSRAATAHVRRLHGCCVLCMSAGSKCLLRGEVNLSRQSPKNVCARHSRRRSRLPRRTTPKDQPSRPLQHQTKPNGGTIVMICILTQLLLAAKSGGGVLPRLEPPGEPDSELTRRPSSEALESSPLRSRRPDDERGSLSHATGGASLRV